MMTTPRVRWKRLLAAGVVMVCAATAQAQYGRGYFREGSMPARFAPAELPDRDFTVCRLMYTRVRIEDMGMGWATRTRSLERGQSYSGQVFGAFRSEAYGCRLRTNVVGLEFPPALMDVSSAPSAVRL